MVLLNFYLSLTSFSKYRNFHLASTIIPYLDLKKQGVFNQKLCIAGSIKLKSYAGRSLFNDLLSAPAARKRAGVVDILDSFPDSQFFLIGDTGEQDLELYAE